MQNQNTQPLEYYFDVFDGSVQFFIALNHKQDKYFSLWSRLRDLMSCIRHDPPVLLKPNPYFTRRSQVGFIRDQIKRRILPPPLSVRVCFFWFFSFLPTC